MYSKRMILRTCLVIGELVLAFEILVALVDGVSIACLFCTTAAVLTIVLAYLTLGRRFW